MWIGAGAATLWLAYSGGRFLLTAPEMRLIHPEQVEVSGNHFVPRTTILEVFATDRGKNILRIPIDERRRQLESISWVEHAAVRRALPNHIQAEITERTPVAFLRQGSDLLLIDAHGVILERPLRADFNFPVVTGLSMDMPLEEREKRMQMFSGFSQQVEDTRAAAMEQVSEVDLSDANDLIATIDGLSRPAADSRGQGDGPIVVHFGNTDFGGKYATLVDHIAQWSATAGRIESVDLRFSREAVVNPEMAAVSQQVQPLPAQPPVEANPGRPPRHVESAQLRKHKEAGRHSR
jgi:cell division protein FtsQ